MSNAKRPYLILYCKGNPFSQSSRPVKTVKSVSAPAARPAASSSSWQSDIAKAVRLLRQGGSGGPPFPAGVPRPVAPRVAPAVAPPRPPMVQATPAAPRVSPQEKHLATGHLATANFTHDEMKLPSDEHSVQLHNDPVKLMGDAAQHKEHLDGLIDRGKGVGTQLGYHIVEGRVPTKEDYDLAHQKGGMVLMAPLKSEGRMKQKAADNYGGDFSKMRDLSRASIAVSHPADIAHVTHKLRQAGLTYGSKPNDRFAKPTEAGYSDIQTEVMHGGHRGELQIHSLDHLQAKEQGFPGVAGGVAGHSMYEELRDMKGVKSPTPAMMARKEELNQKSRELYGEANRRMATRTPRLAHQSVEKSVNAGGRNRGINSVERRAKMDTHTHNAGNFAVPAAAHEAHGDGGNTVHHALKPGFFNWNGLPAKREHYAGTPEFFNGHEWKFVDEGKFAHEAHRIEEHEFNALLGLRKHQHGEHVASTGK